MAKLDLIPKLLETLVTTPNITVACKTVGIAQPTVYRWLVRSRAGDEDMQRVNFMGVEAPFHLHFDNASRLSASGIEKAALDRSLNGTWTPATENGRPVWKLKDPKIIADEIELGIHDNDPYERDNAGNRIQEQVWSPPSAQLTVKMLESHFVKRYGSRQQLDVNVAHVLTLTRPEERVQIKSIEHQPEVFDDEQPDEKETALSIAAGRPATTPEEFDTWSKAGEFEHAEVSVDMGDGKPAMTVKADLDPLQVQPHDSPLVRDLKERAKIPPKNPRPNAPTPRVGKPEDDFELPTPGEPPRKRAPIVAVQMPKDKQVLAARPGDSEFIGAGPDPATSGGSRGFRVDGGPVFDARGRPLQRLNLTRPGRPNRTRGP